MTAPIPEGPLRATVDLPPLQIGPHTLQIATPSGSSNVLQFLIEGSRPPVLTGQSAVIEGNTLTLDIVADRGTVTFLFASPDSAASIAPGLLALDIGAGFTTLIDIATLQHDAFGDATFTVTVPPVLPPGVFPLQFQCASIYTSGPGVPLATSQRKQVLLVGQ